ncbi:MAG TPA: hypothetical protein VLT87_11755 [Thermoanaerobaculia bacterium]|nr:hypothetical protein [Thermoanaerobaculia bacterium]
MLTILELADIHVLIDIDRSENMEFEFERSRRLARGYNNPTALSSTFGINLLSTFLFRPVQILVTSGSGKAKFVRRKRMGIVYLPRDGNWDRFDGDFEIVLTAAKHCRLQHLQQTADWISQSASFFVGTSDAPRNEVEIALVRFTEMAKLMAVGKSVDAIEPVALELAKESEILKEGLVAAQNAQRAWRVKLEKGEIEIPAKFWVRYRLLIQRTQGLLGNFNSPGLLSKCLRLAFNSAAFLYAAKLGRIRRKQRKKARNAQMASSI